jgi:predicted RNase H-like nuclease
MLDASRALAPPQVARTFAEVVIIAGGASLTLVDIPIGLPSAECPRLRLCDTMARERLGARASSVFAVPAREAVWAPGYAEACRRNLEILGRELSKQSWGICPKIREADAVFRLAPRLQESIRETHPELCFRLLNGGQPLENPKKTRAGRRVRRELLRSWTSNLETVLKHKPLVAPDDLLDAVAAAVVARMAWEGSTGSVPLAREYDACGLAMEIVGV